MVVSNCYCCDNIMVSSRCVVTRWSVLEVVTWYPVGSCHNVMVVSNCYGGGHIMASSGCVVILWSVLEVVTCSLIPGVGSLVVCWRWSDGCQLKVVIAGWSVGGGHPWSVLEAVIWL